MKNYFNIGMSLIGLCVLALTFMFGHLIGYGNGLEEGYTKLKYEPVFVNSKYVFCDTEDCTKKYAQDNSKSVQDYQKQLDSFKITYVKTK